MRPRSLSSAFATILIGAAFALTPIATASAACALSVAGISPSVDFVTGGTTATISGCDFNGSSLTVQFGTTPVKPTVNSDTSMTVTTPPMSAGQTSVTVSVKDKNVTSTASTGFTYVPLPSISSIIPTSGPEKGGTSIQISGTDLTESGATTTVAVGSNAATVTAQSATSLTATTPPGTGSQKVSVTVALAGGATSSATGPNFTYVPAPTVTSVTPASGPVTGGTDVTVTGTGFQPGARVYFGPNAGSTNVTGDIAASPVSVTNATTIVATTPAGIVGATNVVVVNPDGQSGSLVSSSTNHFSFTGTAPTLTGVAPSSGTSLGGTSITLTGQGFLPGASVAFVDATTVAAASNGVDVSSLTGAQTLSVASTADFAPTGSLTVATSDGTATISYSGVSGSTFTGCARTSGTGIISTGAAASAQSAATDVVVSGDGTSLTALTPAHPTGTPSILVTNVGGGTASATGLYTFNAAAAPTVTAVSASTTTNGVASGSSLGGTQVTISGTNFVSGATVLFGDTPAAGAAVLSPTSIAVTAPAHSAATVDVSVRLADGQTATLTNSFAFTAAAAPTISSTSTILTSSGTEITINGANFAFTGANGNAVTPAVISVGSPCVTGSTSSCLQSLPATQVGSPAPALVVNATLIQGLLPNEPAGPVTITVTNPDGQSATTTYTYTDFAGPPTLSALSPSSGSSLGDTSVTLTGTEFNPGATVSFASSTSAAQATVTSISSSGTSITALTPAGIYGLVSVTVTNPGGLSATLANAFTFTTASQPTISSISPTTGSGCTLVTVTGTGFANTNATSTNSTISAAVTVGGHTLLPVSACPTQIAAASNGVAVSAFSTSGVLSVVSTAAFPASGSLQVATSTGTAVLSYTGTSSGTSGSSFTGVTLTSGSGTLATGAAVSSTDTQPVVESATTIVGETPSLPTGAYDVAVMNPDGQGAIVAGGFTYPVDTSAPSIAATGNSGAYTFGTWSTGPVTVGLSATDTQSGVASITYALSGAQTGGATVAGANTSVTVSAQGTTTVTYSATDNAGNSTPPPLPSAVVKIDSIAPSLSASASAGSAAYVSGTSTNQSVVVTFTCADSGSGVGSLTYTSNAGAVSASGTNPLAVTVSNTSPGTNLYVTGTCTDAAGNVTTTTFSGINIVLTVPVITASASAGGAPYVAGTWTNQIVTVSFTCTAVSLSQPIVSLTSPVQVSSETSDGSVTGTCEDSVGNVASVTFTPIKIDTAPPVITTSASTTNNNGQTVPYSAGTWTNHSVTVTFTCQDTGNIQSGVTTAQQTQSVTITTPGDTSGVTGNCVDLAGNAAVQAFFGPILIDETAPSVTASISPNPLSPANGKLVTVTALVTVSDLQSGPSNWVLVSVTSNNPSTLTSDVIGFIPNTESATGQLRATKGRIYTFTYQGFDVAGNASGLVTVTVTVK